MAASIIPEGGLVLPPAPTDAAAQIGTSLPQIIQLGLENGMLHDMMKAARLGARKPQLSFGKTLVGYSTLDTMLQRQAQ